MKKAHFCFILALVFTSAQYFNAQTVKIGTQVWMTKNLDVKTFRNGEAIPQAKTDGEWKAAGENKQAAWCFYDNDAANGAEYGILYNWYAVNDPRGLAPAGYHIPSDAEWTKLSDFTNSSRLYGIPGGDRDDNGYFESIGLGGWWSSTEYGSGNAFYSGMDHSLVYFYTVDGSKARGCSVRCVKD